VRSSHAVDSIFQAIGQEQKQIIQKSLIFVFWIHFGIFLGITAASALGMPTISYKRLKAHLYHLILQKLRITLLVSFSPYYPYGLFFPRTPLGIITSYLFEKKKKEKEKRQKQNWYLGYAMCFHLGIPSSMSPMSVPCKRKLCLH
jgi:hypothetical protein